MNYAIIENNKIVNVSVSDTALSDNWIELQDGFSIGDNYIDGVFSKDIPPIEVPQTITVRQAREQLIKIGLLSKVQSEIDKITDITQREIVQNYWEYSMDFKRDNDVLISLAYSLGLSDDDTDNLFIEASKL